jgi:hypothetical protein
LADDPTKTNPPLQKVTDLHTAASWLINPSETADLSVELQSAAAQLRAAIEDGDISTIEFWFSHNLADNPDVDSELEQVAVTAKALLDSVYGELAAGIDCRSFQVGRDKLDQLYARRTQRILIEDTIAVPADAWFEEDGGAWRAVCTSVPGEWLRELHATFGADRLFSGNVRDYLGRKRSDKNINFGIEQTAKDRPEDFWAFNNGITALVSEVTSDQDAGTLSIRGITIVNGAQTTGALAAAPNAAGVRVLARFVECLDSEVIESIIRANNTQNEIRASDFRSTDPQQTRLRDEFLQIPGAHYAGARRGELVGSSSNPDEVFIGADQAAQALAAFHGEPQRAYHGKSKIWENDALYATFFSDQTSAAHIVFVVSLQRAISSLKRRLRDNDSRGDVENGILTFLSQRGAPFLLMAAIGSCQEIVLNENVSDTYKISFGTLVSPEVAEEHWQPLVESLVAFHSALAGAAESGKIRLKEVRDDALSNFRAQVYAMKAALDGPIFEPFRAQVIVA